MNLSLIDISKIETEVFLFNTNNLNEGIYFNVADEIECAKESSVEAVLDSIRNTDMRTKY